MATNRVSTLAAEVLSTGGTAKARASSLSAEVLNTGGAVKARISMLAVEVLSSVASTAKTSQPVIVVNN